MARPLRLELHLHADTDPVKEAIGGLIIGSEEFLGVLKNKISQRQVNDYSGKKTLSRRPMEEVVEHLSGEDRKTSIYALWKFS